MSPFSQSFWTTKSETLTQDLVGTLIKTVVFSFIAFLVMEYAKSVMEVHEKRRALASFQNRTIQDVISKLQDSWTNRLGCTMSLARFEDHLCLTGLREFRVELAIQQELASGILDKQFIAFSTTADTLDSLIAIHGQGKNSTEVKAQSDAVKSSLRLMINDLAREIR